MTGTMRDGTQSSNHNKQLAYLSKHQMDDEHFALIVDLLNVWPLEMVRLATALKGEDARMVDSQV